MKKKPKILFIQKPKGGGSVIALFEMVKMLNRQKFEPIILCYELNNFTRVLKELGVKVIYLSTKTYQNSELPPAKKPSRLFAPLRKLKRLIIDDRRKSKQIANIIREQRIDIIHHNNDVNESRQAILANRRNRVPQICHYRSLKPYYNDLIGRKIDYFLSKNVDHHLYISHAVEWHFTESLRIKKNKGTVIRDIVDTNKFKPRQKSLEVLKEFDLEKTHIVLSNIGRISRWKGQHVFIEALAALNKTFGDFKALIVGPSETGVGDPIYNKMLQKLVVDLGLQDKVFFTGNRTDIPEILSVSDIVVHSSIEPEPQGLIIIEALMYGKPVIVSDAGGAAELIVNNQGGYKVEPGNVVELLKAMQTIIKERADKYHSIHTTKRPAILRDFNPEAQIKVIENLYASLLPKHSFTP